MVTTPKYLVWFKCLISSAQLWNGRELDRRNDQGQTFQGYGMAFCAMTVKRFCRAMSTIDKNEL